jgi:hypothetical protein
MDKETETLIERLEARIERLERLAILPFLGMMNSKGATGEGQLSGDIHRLDKHDKEALVREYVPDFVQRVDQHTPGWAREYGWRY